MSGVCCGSVGIGDKLDQSPPLCRPLPLEGTGAGLVERSSGGLRPTEGNAGKWQPENHFTGRWAEEKCWFFSGRVY